MLKLLTFLHREMKGTSARIVGALLIAGLSRGALLAIFNEGAALAMARTLTWQLPTAFMAVMALYLLASYDAIHHSVRAVEIMRERVRVRLADKLLFAQLRFLEIKGNEAKIVSFFAKKARGLMARYMIDNRIDRIDGLKDFRVADYQFRADLSKDGDWVFTRPQPALVTKPRKAA